MSAPARESTPDDLETVRFYYSFRSPYAWLATERLEAVLGDTGVAIERHPIFPTPGHFPNDPAAMPAKSAYLLQDVARLAREQGLPLRFPTTTDTDWAFAHAAALAAGTLGGEHRFSLAVFRARFSEGRDVGDPSVLAEAARSAELDPDAVLEGARSAPLREAATAGWQAAMARDAIFGVPSFVFAGRLYFGQDRMHFLRAAVERKRAVRSA